MTGNQQQQQCTAVAGGGGGGGGRGEEGGEGGGWCAGREVGHETHCNIAGTILHCALFPFVNNYRNCVAKIRAGNWSSLQLRSHIYFLPKNQKWYFKKRGGTELKSGSQIPARLAPLLRLYQLQPTQNLP